MRVRLPPRVPVHPLWSFGAGWRQPVVADESCFATPKDVRAVVEYALERGWRPDERGGMYVVRGTLAPRVAAA
ncbi:hypothetical protein [Dactylosporangium sp. CS-033363]|uniref:hypothetical protein n=1 Tax=Dactylosporangium sp. CS-033363 TaxID=3239935 RepID=UPI003D8C5C8C